VILPDNDEAGKKHAKIVAKNLYEIAKEIRIVELPGLPPKGDVSDWLQNGGTKEKLIKLAKETHIWKFSVKNSDDLLATIPFRCLGYNHGIYYYLPMNSKQVVQLTPDKHTVSNLITLAPLNWWDKHFPGKSSPNWSEAKDKLFRMFESVGIYDPKRIRGCGAWFDYNRVVLHMGDRLLLDGTFMSIIEIESHNIYELAPTIEITDAKPLTKE